MNQLMQQDIIRNINFFIFISACDCNGMSNECYFDEELYRKTGHGGHCINCLDNRGGIHCEQCLPNHYINKRTNRCTPCNCDETGSEDLQCNEDGQCLCKPGVTGQRCERCEDNYYDLSIYGCRFVFPNLHQKESFCRPEILNSFHAE